LGPTTRSTAGSAPAWASFEGRKGETGRADLELLPRDGGFDIVVVTSRQAEPSTRFAALAKPATLRP
jgi:hypothetical protein